MTVICRSPAFVADPTAAGTHVLAIGVGHYDHLLNGKSALAPVTLGLGQLDSPPISVRAFCDWLLALGKYAGVAGAGLRNPSAPLATVELLVSPEGTYNDGSGAVQVDYPSIAAIRKATADWYARCDTNTSNVGMFYFCGHGVELASAILVAADFGHDQYNAWDGLFNITTTAFYARKSQARTMCFFIDACRLFSNPIAQQVHAAIQPLLMIPQGPQLADQYLFLPANGTGLAAFAPKADVSLFTAALISAFHEHGAKTDQSGNAWIVTNESLALSVRELLKVQAKLGFKPQVPPPIVEREGPLHVPHEPKVPIFVDCDPEAARPHTEYRLDVPPVAYNRLPDNSPWSISVSPGMYDVHAVCESPYNSAVLPKQLFAPPHAFIKLMKVL
jgi:Caspase domain